MKRRRLWIAASVAIFVITCLIALNSRPGELDFLRRYPHTETVSPTDMGWARLSPYWSSANRLRTFSFREVTPELFAEIKKRSKTPAYRGEMTIDFPSGRKAIFEHRLKDSRLVFFDEPPPTWFAQQWASVREYLGMVSESERTEVMR